MEPVLFVLAAGLLGGLVLALLITVKRPSRPSVVVPWHLTAPSPSHINMAHIRVEGIGGLGMVAAVVTVAIADPRIRLAILLAGCLGTALALILIALRRRSGAMPWSGDGTDDRLTLRIDSDERRALAAARGTGNHRARPRTTGLRALPHSSAG